LLFALVVSQSLGSCAAGRPRALGPVCADWPLRSSFGANRPFLVVGAPGLCTAARACEVWCAAKHDRTARVLPSALGCRVAIARSCPVT
jgi:hypothetical protein